MKLLLALLLVAAAATSPLAGPVDGAPVEPITNPADQPLVVSMEGGAQTYVTSCVNCGYGSNVEPHVKVTASVRLAKLGAARIFAVVPVDISEAFDAGPVLGETMFDYRTTSITPGLEAQIPLGPRTAISASLGYGKWNTNIACNTDCDGYLVNGPHDAIRVGAGLRHQLTRSFDLTVDAELQRVFKTGTGSVDYPGVFVGFGWNVFALATGR
jgi:hypothetical protein